MRLPLLALLCVGTVSFCQSPTAPQVDPGKLFQMPEKFSQQAPDFKEFKQLPPMKNDLILEHPTLFAPKPKLKLNNPQIDPKIILHPPWHSQSKGQDVAHHLYPNLKFLPLHRGDQTQR